MKKQIIRVILALSALTVSTTRAQSIYEPYAFTTPAGLALNSGTNDGTGSLARFYQPWGLAVDGVGNIYVADTLNQTIRKMSPAGVVTTLAGVVVEALLGGASAQPVDPLSGLSAREREGLQLIAEGMTSKEAATRLNVAASTIETHRKQISAKLGLHSVAELTKLAIRAGLTSVD